MALTSREMWGTLWNVRAGAAREMPANDRFFDKYYEERTDLMVRFDNGSPWFRNRVRRFWAHEPVPPSPSPSQETKAGTSQ